eukprot:424304-Amorphochlora_amoeboformis.AAC.1
MAGFNVVLVHPIMGRPNPFVLRLSEQPERRYQKTWDVLEIFGRLADHMGIGNSKYIPDKPLPFALWISLPLSRRLKNDKPQWKVSEIYMKI